MFFGVLLIITWLVLLLRYPAKALPVSLAAAVGLGFVAVWVVWLDNREASQLARLELRITYAPQDCPADRPLKLTLNNGNDVPLTNCAGAWPPMRRAIRSTWPTMSTLPALSRPRRVAGGCNLGGLPAHPAAAPWLSPTNPGISRRAPARQFLD